MKTAMILAAGRGERLRPFTDHHPKALCTLYNKPLIAHHLQNLAQSGYQRVIINHAYLGDQIRRFVNYYHDHGLEIVFSPEPPGGLETGGGIVNALHVLGSEPFITLNADIYIDYDLTQLSLPAQSLAHVILVQKPSYRTLGDYGLSQNGTLNNTERDYIFSGLTVYRPEFFKHSMTGRYSVTPLMRQLTELNHITGEVHQGTWFDIGTPEQLRMAEKKKMNLSK
ncbi:MAG: mannose-1-phosphate guanylyltransferase [Legionella sp.]|nr:MAG: mannose-1-phosphate guanylyltransferase [Legionella sp.]